MQLLVRTALALALGVSGASAQQTQAVGPRCGPWERVVEALGESHGEDVAFVGMEDQGVTMPPAPYLVYVFVNADTGTWTIVRRGPAQDVACLVSSGQNWTEAAEPPAGDPT